MRSHGSRGSRLPGGSVAQPHNSNRQSESSEIRVVDRMGYKPRQVLRHCSSHTAPSGFCMAPATVVLPPQAVGSASAAALTLTVAVVARELSLAHAGEVVTHLIESRLIALALDLSDVRRGEGELQLLRCEKQIAARDLVLTHVEVGIPGIAGGARREGGEADLVGRG